MQNETQIARISGASAALIALCDLIDSALANDGFPAMQADCARAAEKVEAVQAYAARDAIEAAAEATAGDCVVLSFLLDRIGRSEAAARETIARVTPASARRIAAAYEARIGYNPLSEGVAPRAALQTLREHSAASGLRARLRHHVSGAIARGEAEAVVEIPAGGA